MVQPSLRQSSPTPATILNASSTNPQPAVSWPADSFLHVDKEALHIEKKRKLELEILEQEVALRAAKVRTEQAKAAIYEAIANKLA